MQELCLVAHIAWELRLPSLPGEDATSRNAFGETRLETGSAKLKLYHPSRDSSQSEPIRVLTGRALESRIRARLPEPWCRPTMTEHPLIMEIYDSEEGAYRSIYDLRDDDIYTKFGNKPKLLVRVEARQEASPTDKRLAIKGRFYEYNAEKGVSIAGRVLKVHEENHRQNAGTGVTVWDGALLLAQYLDRKPTLVENKRVLELGAGCGLVGMAAGVLGAQQVLLTDLEYAIPNMQENVERHADLYSNNYNNDRQAMICYPLDWTKGITWDEIGTRIYDIAEAWIPDVILVADCVWMQTLVEPLLSIIDKLTPPVDDTTSAMKVLLSYQRRGKSTHEEFWDGIHTRFPNAIVSEIDVADVGLAKPDVIYLLSVDFGCDSLTGGS